MRFISKLVNGKIVGVHPVRIGAGELEPDAAERFEQLESETPVEGLGEALAQYVIASPSEVEKA